MINKIQSLSEKYIQDIIDIRRHIHAHPELSFQEHKTSVYIFEKLQELGLKPKYIAGTGVTATIEGNGDKTIALRADIDALPIHENTGLAFSSKNDGIMHACGHDMHTASLLGAARILSELKAQLQGNVKLIFQPAEEKAPGGAIKVIEENFLEEPYVSRIFGQHVYPELETGYIGIHQGEYMASSDEIFLHVKGKGGHAAMPWKLIDPVLVMSHIITSLQQVVSRNSYPATPTVLSFGKLESKGGAVNIIPDEVHASGTFRTFDEKWRKEALEKIQKIASGIATSMGAKADVEIIHGYPVLKNDETVTKRVRQYAIDYLGKDKLVDLDVRMTSEDFAYFSHERPASYWRVGTANKQKGIDSNLHTTTFNVDEDAMLISTGFMAYTAIKELEA